MKAISYSLFGHGKPRQENSFDFHSYIRGLMVNIRMNRLIYPDWEIILHTDKSTHEGYKDLFDNIGIQVRVCEDAPLCLAMLWRLKPVFESEDGVWKYSHVLCRDLDSPTTYREAQAVEYWIKRDKALHAITDSVSHNLPLLGGMIGIRPAYFTERVAQTWEDMIRIDQSINYTRKGSDQTFLNKHIYPRFAKPGHESITQHYFNGMGNTFLNDYRTCTCPPTKGHEPHCYNNTELNLPFDLSESNAVCGHIGAAGFYESAMFKFLRKYWNQFPDLLKAERNYPKIFYWANE